MSHPVRFADGTGAVRVGLLTGEQLRPLAVASMSDLLRRPVAEIRELAEAAGEPVSTAGTRLLPPLDGRMEVWAAGVTYLRSEEARREESADEDVYARVYRAKRPELFFKSAAWRVVTDGEPVAIRADSANNVPEPELGRVRSRPRACSRRPHHRARLGLCQPHRHQSPRDRREGMATMVLGAGHHDRRSRIQSH
ncbi:hypothetical protein [Amycolatopsis sp. MtRt-6]|uniref:hypothetical protein n=1 Tax=Amycolatopsis sp. MtRt-6 TaxID=2792782 RepID=UPI001F5D2F2F|nr:hypothetical protein [Amycolatopsis sp. MtRt-6]